MSKDKIEGLMIGLGLGVLVATFIKSAEAPAKLSDKPIDAGPRPASDAPADIRARAART